MIPKIGAGKLFIRCNKCNFSKEVTKDLIAKEKIKHKAKRGKGVSKDENVFATYDHKCEKCNYEFEKEKIPKRCPYCSAEKTIIPYKTAQDLVDETES